MTFTEAAVEVLRLAGKPLHYKKITSVAIERNLLSHVGKTPEITMSSRLATMVKKDRGSAPIVKVKPGVFGLREFAAEVLEAARAESGHDAEIPVDTGTDIQVPQDAPEADGTDPAIEAPAALPGAEVYPEEEGDDDLILANLDDPGDEGGPKRRRRRRRRKPGEAEGEASADADAGPSARASDRERPARRERSGQRERSTQAGSRRSRSSRNGAAAAPPPGDWQRAPEDGELVGLELADAIYAALERKGSGTFDYQSVAELLIQRGRLQGGAEALASTVSAAVRGDVARAQRLGERPRFRASNHAVALSDWSLPQDALRAERDARQQASRQREAARRALLRVIQDLPAAGLVELLASWLNAEGVVGLRAIRRAGAEAGEFHLAGTLKRDDEPPTHLAIVAIPAGTSVGRERVIELRGALHHYGNATTAWLITTGQVLSGAHEEADTQGAAPCGLFDGQALARALERQGIGLQRHELPLLGLDVELIESLGGRVRERAGQRSERDRSERGERTERDRSERGERTERGEGRTRRRRGSRRGSGAGSATEEADQQATPAASPDGDPSASSEQASDEQASGDQVQRKAAQEPDLQADTDGGQSADETSSAEGETSSDSALETTGPGDSPSDASTPRQPASATEEREASPSVLEARQETDDAL